MSQAQFHFRRFQSFRTYAKREKKEASRLLSNEQDARAPSFCVSLIVFTFREGMRSSYSATAG